MTGIALVGRSRSGKTVLGAALHDLSGMVPFALADDPKRIFGEATGMNFFDEAVKVKQRGRLIEFAELCRKVEPMCWVKRAPVDDSNVVITDVRMMHEFEYFRRKGYYMVGIEVEDDVLLERGGYIPVIGDPDYQVEYLIGQCDLVMSGVRPPREIAALIVQLWADEVFGDTINVLSD